ncbi:MAG: DivIVA domain-containing protein [Nocardioides sp.]
MSDQTSFKTVMRGYDPAEVDRRLEELTSAVGALTQQRDGLAARVQELHDAASTTSEPPSFEHLGDRVGQILSLADAEASELRQKARDDAEAHSTSVHATAAQARDEADQYAARTRSEADSAAARIEEDARKAADEHRDGAERDASVRLQEAEAVYEEQRARAAKAAADFETTLAGRRQAAEDEFTQKMAESQGRLDEAHQLAERTRTDAEHARLEAGREASRLVEEARQEAARIVNDAKATAERVRGDSDRELAAASQRRDSINAQLANVRQMLATLTGTAQMPLSAFGADDEDDPADPADTADTADAPDAAGASGESDETADDVQAAVHTDGEAEGDVDDSVDQADETEDEDAGSREESLAETRG